MTDARRALSVGALGALLTLTALLVDAEPLYVPGLTFLLLGAGAIVWVRLAARGIVVERFVATPTVEEGQPLTARILVRATRAVLLPGTIADPLLDAGAPLEAGHRTTTVHVSTRFTRRGRRVLEPPAVTLHDPAVLATSTVTGAGTDEVLVLPAVTDLRGGQAAGQSGVLTGRAAGPAFEAEVELDGLRAYRPGAPAARISWAALARTGELLERRLQPEAERPPMIVLDARTLPGAGEEALDEALRATASLCVHLARRGGCALLLPGHRRPTAIDATLGAWPRLHVQLALMQPGGSPAPQALTGRRGAIIYVAARRLATPPRALVHAPGGARLLVVPGTLPGRAAAFAVAGCRGYDLTPGGHRTRAA